MGLQGLTFVKLTFKAHGLQNNMKYYDSFSPDLVDIVYYQAIAEGICEYNDKVSKRLGGPRAAISPGNPSD